MQNTKKQHGFSLMEILVSLFVIMVLMVGIYSLVILYFQISNDNKMHVIAIELANQKMEQIRNMPYDDVGVVSGIPYGIIPQEETVEREGFFIVNNYVSFYDDPADGQAGSTTPDTIPTDYKIATVKVSWQSKNGIKSVTVFSKIIPRTVETDQGYGLLKITVRDSYAQPVPNASVRVVNNAVNPAINVVNLTSILGLLYLPATSSSESYEITVTKNDQEPVVYWGQDQTYGSSTGKAPRHLSVTKGEMTEEEFQIDKLTTLHLRTISTNLPENFQVNLTKSGCDESRPRVAADNSNNLYYAWQGKRSTSSYVYLAKYDSSNNRLWAGDNTVNASVSQSNPDIAATAAGDIFVVWQDRSVSLKKITMASGERRYAMVDREPGKNMKLNNTSRIIIKDTFVWLNKWNNKIKLFMARFYKKSRIALGIVDYWSQRMVEHIARSFQVKEAKAVATIVQSIKVSGVVVSNNIATLSFTNPPTAGNLLVVVAIHENSNQAFTTVTNSAGSFTVSAVSDVGFGLDVGIWHKIAGASEPSAVTVNANGNFEGGVMMLMEVSGIDPSDPVDIVKTNDQTGGSSRTATTDWTAVSAENGFAVAAIAFADNDFNDPISANWSSGSATAWTQRNWTEIDGNDDTSIGVATMDVTAAAAQRATLALTGGGSSEERNSVMVVYNLFDPDDVRVEAGGSQNAYLLRSSSNGYVGGYFAISDLTGTHNVTGISIKENGTIDAKNNLDNIRLVYDLDIVPPYNCADEVYNGTEPQFGSTDTDGFSAADGTVVMNGSVAITLSKAMCVYVVLDVGAGAAKDETIELEISNPSADVTINAGTVIPATPSVISGTTKVSIPAEFRQTDYRWRSDYGDEVGSYWLTEANSAVLIQNDERIRLRFRVENVGSLSASAAYRLEFGEKVTTCSALGGGSWTALPSNNTLDWRSTSSAEYADGDPTTQQLGSGGFVAGEIKEDDSQTSGLELNGDTATELEFSLTPTLNAEDSTYCFRLTNAGVALSAYETYAEINVAGDENIYIVRMNSAGNQVWAAKRVNNDDSSADQSMPRLALTENFGTATTVIVWLDNRSGNSDIYAQAFDAAGIALWNGGNEIAISASSTDETEATVVIDSNDEVVFAWTEEGAIDKIYLMKYSLLGNPLWPAPVLGPVTTFGISEPSLTADSSGNFYLGYTEEVAGNLSAYGAKYNGTGVKTWDSGLNIDVDLGDRYEAALAVRGASLYAIWTDERDGNENVYGQKFDLDGNPAWSRDILLDINVAVSSSTQPAVAITPSGDVFSAWTDSRQMLSAVYSTKLIAPGPITPAANVPLHIWGTNTKSESPLIYEYNLNPVTNASGQVDIRVETDPGGYMVEASSTAAVSVILLDPPAPWPLLPGQDQIWNIYIQ